MSTALIAAPQVADGPPEECIELACIDSHDFPHRLRFTL